MPLFISFSCLIALGRNSNTVSKRSGESKHPCCVPDLVGKAFSFHPYDVHCRFFLVLGFVLFCFCFLGPYLQLMDLPRLGVQLEL